ncbi:hypothetical protein EST38_g14417, partial [Candolleomyces aberdarensis]
MDDDLTIPFPFPDPGEGNGTGRDHEWLYARAQRRNQFWDSPTTLDWFKARGYTLYKRIPDHRDSPWLTAPQTANNETLVYANYPYSGHDSSSTDKSLPARCAIVKTVGVFKLHLTPNVYYFLSNVHEQGSVVFAQDEQRRHVAIKLVPKDTDELKIYEFIQQQDMKTLEENSILPVLEILHIKSHCFVVMPRWGGGSIIPEEYSCTGELLALVHSLLKGLAFLHNNGIAHRDLALSNVLCNHFSNEHAGGYFRSVSRRNRTLQFAIFDFDISIMVPPNASRSKFRLPYWRNWEGSAWVYDVDQGELDYDPFAYDV